MKFSVTASVALVALVAATQAQNTCSCDPSDYQCMADCGNVPGWLACHLPALNEC